MKNFVISINKDAVENQAESYFIADSGIGRQGAKYEKMRNVAKVIQNEISDRVSINAVMSTFSGASISNEILSINGLEFHCPHFCEFSQDDILDCYIYIITAGDFSLEGRPMSEQLLADIWGNAYLDAGRDDLEKVMFSYCEKKLNKLKGAYNISNSFGPGLFGMPTEEIHNIFNLVDASKIDVEYHKSGVMVPIKSCAGIYFVLKKEAKFVPIGCDTCIGNSKSCVLCNYKRKLEN